MKTINSNFVLAMFIIASLATLGSLFFSEVMEFIPCSMCWYQRIFMYPLVLIFLLNLLYPDDKLFKYSAPLVVVGLLFAIYHNLLMWGIIPESAVPCKQGVPCSTEYFEYLGFINIPFLSLAAYVLIAILLISGQKKIKS
ncbi:disulfide bond formation protein B [Halarcobacter bivalviorum]|uniref:Disulfide bond formation protein B n=1 Tax=Halarcobacter bivalviorum TaxID=663364 RepID=A0AAX2AB63_9BACT|nr:disulfide bond formation protein B [Halarcobacter bivalviorum]AXH12754.1 protein disulfide oxidoreductase [Halarcobacter bivalviorum]RXK08185.1 disulfide bond formation protein B [Halarcobacter bivalviorum]RXK10328.1 disulfide bond formation protein B [Halarcobacter bivalviorum]